MKCSSGNPVFHTSIRHVRMGNLVKHLWTYETIAIFILYTGFSGEGAAAVHATKHKAKPSHLLLKGSPCTPASNHVHLIGTTISLSSNCGVCGGKTRVLFWPQSRE